MTLLFRFVLVEGDEFDTIWNAAQAFNDDYKVKSWILHHDVRKQKNFLYACRFATLISKICFSMN